MVAVFTKTTLPHKTTDINQRSPDKAFSSQLVWIHSGTATGIGTWYVMRGDTGKVNVTCVKQLIIVIVIIIIWTKQACSPTCWIRWFPKEKVALSAQGFFWFHPVATGPIVLVFVIWILSRCVGGWKLCMYTQGWMGLLWWWWSLLDATVIMGKVSLGYSGWSRVLFGIQGGVLTWELCVLDEAKMDIVRARGS